MKTLTATIVIALATLAAPTTQAQVFGVNVGGVTVGVDGNGKLTIGGGTGPIGPRIADPFDNPRPVFNPVQPRPIFNPVQPRPIFNPVQPRPAQPRPFPGNPVVGGEKQWELKYDPSTGQWIKVRKTVQNLATSTNPYRNVVDPGSMHTTQQRSVDALGNPVIIKTTYWTSYGKPHYKKQTIRVTNRGGLPTVDVNETNAGPTMN